MQALLSPLAGLFGDRVNRVHVIAAASFLWGVMTIAMGLAKTFPQMLAFSCVNGLGLALLIPCVQSLLADYYTPANRGRAFGLLYFTSSLGQMLGTQLSTGLGRKTVAGEEGWRFVFHVVGALSILTSGFVLALARDPRVLVKPPPSQRGLRNHLRWAGARLSEMWRDVGTVVRIPTFVVIFLQGIVGMMPWVAMGFWPTYLQLLGFSDGKSGLIASMLTLGTAFGCQLAGFIGDGMLTKFPKAGRIMTAQFSVLMSLPGTVLLLRGLPRPGLGVTSFGGPAESGAYAATFFFVGLIISWCGTNNSAIFAEIVPVQLRTTVFAFNRCIETSISQVAAKLVALCAVHWFGFEDNLALAVAQPLGSPERTRNATALGNALLFWLLVPWFLCFLAYTGLYCTLPGDRVTAAAIGARLEADAEAKRAAAKLSAGAAGAARVVAEE